MMAEAGAGRVLGVDYGDRRTGIAISDAARVIAFPRETLECPQLPQAAAAVARLAAAEGVARIVVGYPLDMSGGRGPRAERTDAFIGELEARTSIPVERWDERLSTKIAEDVLIAAGTRREARKRHVDKLAAQVILQSWLDARAAPSAAEGWGECDSACQAPPE
jgi:putative Holliday junction resolvase